MPLDWKKLAPHRPLKPGDPLRVPRSDSGGEDLAAQIEAGVETIAVAGPVGSGKSTEMACAADRLKKRFVTFLVPLDRLLDMHQVDEEQVFTAVTSRVFDHAQNNLNMVFSGELCARIAAGSAPRLPGALASPRRDLLLQTLREVAASSYQGAVVLLLDGLEKCSADSATRVVRALLDIREEARLVFVVPFPLAIGSGAHELVSSVDRIFFLRAIPVRRDQGLLGEQGRAFFQDIIAIRLSIAIMLRPFLSVVDRAAEMSGGIVRSFLQLVRAAAANAALAEREMPTEEDLDAAMVDHAESLARLLVDGDIEALRSADGTSGVEVPEERRLRLLMHGLLLEYKTQAGVVVHPAPLLAGLLQTGAMS
jgi:hypothetical protein